MARTSRSAHALTDHEEIRNWAEERGARPTCVRGTGGEEDVGIIRLDFPGYSGQDSLQTIEWDEWFQKFDENNLALLVQEETARGQQSNFNKLVSRDTAEERNEMQTRNHREEGRNRRSTRRSSRSGASTRTERSTGTRRSSTSGRTGRRSATGRSRNSRSSSKSGTSQSRSTGSRARRSTSARGPSPSSRSTRKRSGSIRESSRRRAA